MHVNGTGNSVYLKQRFRGDSTPLLNLQCNQWCPSRKCIRAVTVFNIHTYIHIYIYIPCQLTWSKYVTDVAI